MSIQIDLCMLCGYFFSFLCRKEIHKFNFINSYLIIFVLKPSLLLNSTQLLTNIKFKLIWEIKTVFTLNVGAIIITYKNFFGELAKDLMNKKYGTSQVEAGPQIITKVKSSSP